MRTNTSRVLTAFSDLDHPAGANFYPSQVNMLAYLQRYAETAGLTPHLSLSTRVEAPDHGPALGWIVRSRNGDSVASELFSRIVVARAAARRRTRPKLQG
jgi:dimethylaniline monooxygenase (N-oxide forming)